MKSRMLKVAGAALASALIALPVAAQTSGSGSADTANTAGSGQNYSSNTNNEHHNWGWVGLLGLIGLAGLRRKNDDGYRGNMTGRTAS